MDNPNLPPEIWYIIHKIVEDSYKADHQEKYIHTLREISDLKPSIIWAQEVFPQLKQRVNQM